MRLWEIYGCDPNTGDPPMAMDYRHVEMLREEILTARPRVAVEIGAYRGHSTTAFLEAMRDLPDMHLHVFDTHITPKLRTMVATSSVSDRVFLHRNPVWGSDLAPDFAFIDGDHGLPALADLGWCLAREVPVIAMHDTRTAERLPECWGSAAVAKLLSGHLRRDWTEDCKDRPGENTWRGFGVSRA